MDDLFSDKTLSTVPSELQIPVPRKVRFGGTDAPFLIVIATLFLGAAVGFGVGYSTDAVQQMQRRSELRRNGRSIVGEITRHWFLGRGLSIPYVGYSFAVGGTAYSGEAQMPRDSTIQFHESDHLVIRYLPSDPTINHPDAWEWHMFMDARSVVIWSISVTIGNIALVILFWDRKLVRYGKAVAGTVICCTPNDRLFRLEYKFQTEDGKLMKGHCGCQSSYEAGTHIWVLYLPERPEKNHAYPLSNYRIVT